MEKQHRDNKRAAQRVAFFLAALVGLSVLVNSCGSSRDHPLDRVAGLDPGLKSMLKEGDAARIREFARERGFNVTVDSYTAIEGTANRFRFRGDSEMAESLHPYVMMVAETLRDEFDTPVYVDFATHLHSLSEPDYKEWHMLQAGELIVMKDSSLNARDKIDILERKRDEMARFNAPLSVPQYELELFYAYEEVGDSTAAIRALHSAERGFARVHDHLMTCQVYGVLGHYQRVHGRPDSMMYYYSEGLRIAHEHRLPSQAARLTLFFAGYYKSLGRLGLAHTFIKKSVEVCREYKGEYRELRFVLELIEFYAELGAWDAVARLLPRAAGLAEYWRWYDMDYWNARFNAARARYLMANHQVDEAQAILADNLEYVKLSRAREPYADYLYNWAKDLIANNRPLEAMARVAQATAYCDERSLQTRGALCRLLMAEARLQLLEPVEAEQAMDEFDEMAPSAVELQPGDLVFRDALRVTAALQLDDTVRAHRMVADGFERSVELARETDPSTHGYLLVSGLDRFRQVVHDYLADNAESAYGFEMVWADLYQHLGTYLRPGHGDADPPATPDVFEMSRRRARSANERLRASDAIHAVYIDRGSWILRLAATGTDVRADSLSMSAAGLSSLAGNAWRQMSINDESNRKVTAEMADTLRLLAATLLPMNDVDSHTGPVFITADGFLAMVPFETFNVGGPNEYVPLLARRDIAYVRRYVDDARQTQHSTRVLTLANPHVSESVSRYWALADDIGGTFEESSAFAQSFDSVTTLTGTNATRRSLLKQWRDTGVLHIAAHALREPLVPYLTVIPLASDSPNAAPDEVCLDISWIRGSRLDDCRLVVLSGCSTGAPYVSGSSAGPSIGDAFLDAGAARVVQTFWDVPDRLASDIVGEFAKRLNGEPEHAVAALCQARRQLMAPDGEVLHPFYWAAYSVKQNGLRQTP